MGLLAASRCLPLRASIHTPSDRLKMLRVDALSVRASLSTRTLFGVMARVVKDQPSRHSAMLHNPSPLVRPELLSVAVEEGVALFTRPRSKIQTAVFLRERPCSEQISNFSVRANHTDIVAHF